MVPVLGVVSLVGMVVTMSFSGPLSDRLGRRKVFVIVASLVMAGAMVVPLVMPTITGMIIFTALNGLGFGCYMAVDGALMSEVLPSEGTFAKDLGVLNIAGALPFSLAPALAPAILALSGGSYGVLFTVAGGCAIVGAAAIWPVKGVR